MLGSGGDVFLQKLVEKDRHVFLLSEQKFYKLFNKQVSGVILV